MAYRRRIFTAFTGTSLLAAALALPQAHAAEPKTWYVGASTDDTYVEMLRGFGWDMGSGERGASVRGGWQLNPHFALEVAALRAANLDWTEYFAEVPELLALDPPVSGFFTSRTTFDTTAVHVSAVGSLHWRTIFEAYLKAGLVHYRVDGRQVLDTFATPAVLTRDVGANGITSLVGAGLALNASTKWRVRMEFQYFGIDSDFFGSGSNDPSIDTLAIGFDYQLGRGKAAAKASR